MSPRGGRPTPYCPAEPERYGNWGAKVITCAMLDEHREIWVHLYGPDQPMTSVDLGALDSGLAALAGALEPVKATVAELSTRVTGEAAEALAAKASAEDRCQQAREEADQAIAERDRALAEAADAREQAAADRAERAAAERQAAEALAERDQALADRRAAEKARDDAHTVRQQALDKVGQSQDLVTQLQGTLDNERAAAMQRREQQRLDHAQAMEQLRAALTEDADARVRGQTEEFDQRLRAAQSAAAERADALTEQLAAASRTYAEALAPLHDQIGTLRYDVMREQAEVRAAGQRLESFRTALSQGVDADEPALRLAVRAVLEQSAPPDRPVP